MCSYYSPFLVFSRDSIPALFDHYKNRFNNDNFDQNDQQETEESFRQCRIEMCKMLGKLFKAVESSEVIQEIYSPMIEAMIFGELQTSKIGDVLEGCVRVIDRVLIQAQDDQREHILGELQLFGYYVKFIEKGSSTLQNTTIESLSNIASTQKGADAIVMNTSYDIVSNLSAVLTDQNNNRKPSKISALKTLLYLSQNSSRPTHLHHLFSTNDIFSKLNDILLSSYTTGCPSLPTQLPQQMLPSNCYNSSCTLLCLSLLSACLSREIIPADELQQQH